MIDRCTVADCLRAPVWLLEFPLFVFTINLRYVQTACCKDHVDDLRAYLQPRSITEWPGERAGGEPVEAS